MHAHSGVIILGAWRRGRPHRLDVGQMRRYMASLDRSRASRMRSVHPAWSARLLAAVAALALMLAFATGASAHPGHSHQGPVTHAAVDVIVHQAGQLGAEVRAVHAAHHAHRQHGNGHKCPEGTGCCCCDAACHGSHASYAIVIVAGPVPVSAAIAPAAPPATFLNGVEPGSLERPPNTPVRA
jgi:hypothetical protein